MNGRQSIYSISIAMDPTNRFSYYRGVSIHDKVVKTKHMEYSQKKKKLFLSLRKIFLCINIGFNARIRSSNVVPTPELWTHTSIIFLTIAIYQLIIMNFLTQAWIEKLLSPHIFIIL
ncbi:hypothetical protein OG21DRAFT_1527075 [Imleria badia]|nr:hypothetical protein OG21DRAFT_1527075 [Imleria badia]